MVNEESGLVFGTAGHIDHGKTALIRALTGIDTDRLEEEKRRGISIDLGFAHLEHSDGRRISFIDVPGHERFIKNMLAGAAGIQAVLLVVAANESVKPQTREHLDICRLLGVQHGLIVLTKSDLVDRAQLQRTESDVRNLCAGTFLEDVAIFSVSSITGEGLDELKTALFRLAEQIQQRDSTALARLPIDRSFSIAGFGTVVTGTLWSGRLSVGNEVEHFPSRRALRIRGLEVHGKPVEAAVAGQRTAVNLAGADHSEIHRGDEIAQKDSLEPSSALDVFIQWLQKQPKHTRPLEVTLHLGTAEVMATLKSLDPAMGFARLRLGQPVLALPGDRFVLRQPSPAQTIAGGYVVDAFPPLRMARIKAVDRLRKLAAGDLKDRIELLVEESPQGKRLPELVQATGIEEARVLALVKEAKSLVFSESAHRVLSKAWIEGQQQILLAWMRQWYAKNPSAEGAPMSQARLGLEPAVATLIMQSCPAVEVRGELIVLKSHKPVVNLGQQKVLQQIEHVFREAGFQPPAAAEALRTAGAEGKDSRGLLESLVKQNKLIRISADLVFHADVIRHIRQSLASHKGRRFSVPEFKDWTKISRKYAIPLLEYLDRQHVTKRDGDARVVL